MICPPSCFDIIIILLHILSHFSLVTHGYPSFKLQPQAYTVIVHVAIRYECPCEDPCYCTGEMSFDSQARCSLMIGSTSGEVATDVCLRSSSHYPVTVVGYPFRLVKGSSFLDAYKHLQTQSSLIRTTFLLIATKPFVVDCNGLLVTWSSMFVKCNSTFWTRKWLDSPNRLGRHLVPVWMPRTGASFCLPQCHPIWCSIHVYLAAGKMWQKLRELFGHQNLGIEPV